MPLGGLPVTRAGMFGGNRPVRVVAARPAKAGEVVTPSAAPDIILPIRADGWIS